MANVNPAELVALQYRRIQELEEQHAEELSKLQEHHARALTELEQRWSSRYSQLEQELIAKLEHAARQLNQYRSAFEGNAGSWTVNRDPVTEVETWVNLDTGETSEQKPEVVSIAELMQKLQIAESNAEELVKLKKKQHQLEASTREAQVAVSNCKLEIGSLKQQKGEWRSTAAKIAKLVDATEQSLSALTSKIGFNVDKLASDTSRVAVGTQKLQRASRTLSELLPRLRQAERLNKELQAKCAAYESQHQNTTTALVQLRQDVEKEVERRCGPLRDALAQAQAILVSERVQVAMERSELAELWPQGWLMPTTLQPYKPITPEEYERRLDLAQERDAERALREEVRANVLERTMWTKQLDPYGRTYYSHRGTGEACWEVPAAMCYEPPSGRDELGNPVGETARSTATQGLDPNWTAVTDSSSGKVVFVHRQTGEQRTTPPDGRQPLPKGKDPVARVVDAAKIVVAFMQLCQQAKETRHAKEGSFAADVSSPQQDKNQSVDSFTGDIVKYVSLPDDAAVEEFTYDISMVEEIAAGSMPLEYAWMAATAPGAQSEQLPASARAPAPPHSSPNVPRHKQAEECRTLLRRLAFEETLATKKLDDVRDRMKEASKRLIKVTSATGVAPSWQSSILESPNLDNPAQRHKFFASLMAEYFVLCGLKQLQPSIDDGLLFSRLVSMDAETARWLLEQLFDGKAAQSHNCELIVAGGTLTTSWPVNSINRTRYTGDAWLANELLVQQQPSSNLVGSEQGTLSARDTPRDSNTSEILLIQYPRPARPFLYHQTSNPGRSTAGHGAVSLERQEQQRSDLMKLLLREDLDTRQSSDNVNDNGHDADNLTVTLMLEQANPSKKLSEIASEHDQRLREMHQRITAAAKEIKEAHAKYQQSFTGWKEVVDQRLNVLRGALNSQREEIALQFSALRKFPKPNLADLSFDVQQNAALLQVVKRLRAAYIVNVQTNLRVEFYSSLKSALLSGLAEFEEAFQRHNDACDQYAVFRAMTITEHARHTAVVNAISVAVNELIAKRADWLRVRESATSSLEERLFLENAARSIEEVNAQLASAGQKLLDEGVRKRFTYEDELSAATAELARHQMVTFQYRLFARMVQGVSPNLTQLEQLDGKVAKLMLAEAEVDDTFEAVTGEYGEQYTPAKVWQSPEISRAREQAAAFEETWRQFFVNFVQQIELCQELSEALAARWNGVNIREAEMWVPRAELTRAKEQFEARTEQLTIREQEVERRRIEMETAVEHANRSLKVALEDHRSSQAAVLKQNEVLRRQLQTLATWFRTSLLATEEKQKTYLANARADVTQAYKDAQALREKFKLQEAAQVEALSRKDGLVTMLAIQLEEARSRAEMEQQLRETQVTQARETIFSLRTQFRAERSYSAKTALLLRLLRAIIGAKDAQLAECKQQLKANKALRYDLQSLSKQVREYKTVIAKLFTDPDRLFQFFVRRVAALAGCGKSFNDALRSNGAADICVALLNRPGCATRQLAARALAEMTWDGSVEKRFIVWGARAHWRRIAEDVLAEAAAQQEAEAAAEAEVSEFDQMDAPDQEEGEFLPPPDVNLRTFIKQRRQQAIHDKRKSEGLNQENCKLVNKGSGAIDALIDVCMEHGDEDWRIAASAALAVSTSSSDEANRTQLAQDPRCMCFLVGLLHHADPEVQMHSAVAIANIAFNNEAAQTFLGNNSAVENLLALCTSNITDVLEATTAALVNVACFNDANCKRVVEAGGVPVLLDLVHTDAAESPLDEKQAAGIYANVVETMANVCRYCPTDVGVHFTDQILGDIVLLCASENIQIQRHVPLMIGNLAQHEQLRESLGRLGAVEALLVLLDLDDLVIQSNVLWALCNLLWNSANQQRLGRYLPQVCAKLESAWLPVRTHCLLAISNAAYFNDANRTSITELDGCLPRIVGFVERPDTEDAVLEASLRALVVLSYELVDAWELQEQRAIAACLKRLREQRVSEESKRLALELLINLCARHENQSHLFNIGGVATLVELQAHKDETIVTLSHELLQFMGKPPSQEELLKAKKQPDVQSIAALTDNDDELVRVAAMQSLDEQLYDPVATISDPAGALAVCLKVVANPYEPPEVLLPALWGARSLIKTQPELKDNFRQQNGIEALVHVVRRVAKGEINAENAAKVLNISLACLAVAVMAHRENSRALLACGVQLLLDIAERKPAISSDGQIQKELEADNVVAVSSAILRSVGWFSQAKCPNCHAEQTAATHCFSCGNRLFKHAVR